MPFWQKLKNGMSFASADSRKYSNLKNMTQQKGKIGVTTENIFPVIKKFLYSDHEIFLREIVANAVDATQKVKALANTADIR